MMKRIISAVLCLVLSSVTCLLVFGCKEKKGPRESVGYPDLVRDFVADQWWKLQWKGDLDGYSELLSDSFTGKIVAQDGSEKQFSRKEWMTYKKQAVAGTEDGSPFIFYRDSYAIDYHEAPEMITVSLGMSGWPCMSGDVVLTLRGLTPGFEVLGEEIVLDSECALMEAQGSGHGGSP